MGRGPTRVVNEVRAGRYPAALGGAVGLDPTSVVISSETGRYPAAHGGAAGIDPTGWTVTVTMRVMVARWVRNAMVRSVATEDTMKTDVKHVMRSVMQQT